MKTELGKMREAALSDPAVSEVLQSLRSAYEAGFGSTSEIERNTDASIFWDFEHGPRIPPPETGLPTGRFEHRETKGMGDTAKDAMIDWRADLDKCPQTGKAVVWRVPPEIDCWCDFTRNKLVWKVYARMAIVP